MPRRMVSNAAAQMLLPDNPSIGTSLVLFVAATIVIGIGGVWLVRKAERLADATSLGQAITGAVVLGAITSLSGSVTSITAAYDGHPALAVSNGLGGIAAQTVFLVLADLAYRKANLEHAAASLVNLFNGCLLIVLLNVVLIGALLPDWTLFAVHPATVGLFALYLIGLRMAHRVKLAPMWGPAMTAMTESDDAGEQAGSQISIPATALAVVALGAAVSVAGYIMAKTGVVLASELGLGEGVVGALFTAVATSMPELVTTLVAVRRGALTLAVGGILGGNTFDVLFVAFADIAYRDGSIYHTMDSQQFYLITLTVVMTGVLLMGLLRRQRHGFANIGFESMALLLLYGGGMLIFATAFPS